MKNTINTRQQAVNELNAKATGIGFRSFGKSDYDAFQGADDYSNGQAPIIAEAGDRIIVCAKQGVTIVIEGEDNSVCYQLITPGNVKLHKLIARGAAQLSPSDLCAHGFEQVY